MHTYIVPTVIFTVQKRGKGNKVQTVPKNSSCRIGINKNSLGLGQSTENCRFFSRLIVDIKIELIKIKFNKNWCL
jgi:hypothetical protein